MNPTHSQNAQSNVEQAPQNNNIYNYLDSKFNTLFEKI